MNNQSKRREVLAIIPARGGSKGVPRKNLFPLCGEPLISYSIKVALASNLITRVVVSTEDEEIAEVSRSYGADVPFLRPKELAGDCSNLDDSFAYTLSKLSDSGYVPDSVVFCFPTSPFRTPRFIDHMVSRLCDGYKNVLTAKNVAGDKTYYSEDKIRGTANSVRIDRNGMRYFKIYNIFSGYNVLSSPRGAYIYHVEDPVMLIDIDTPADFRYAEMVIQAGLFDFSLN
ncbi:cytidylyltransferase domain-containing protein [Fundidesulfovibrio terrae]|uniref:acylneuraminate cytidylyltransferase family protein n=1 Tax=Fundidesulfovibrio terrae TaxID=2922866 RepID=UPI001FAF8080|nr:acylneuraminate cytidylyltransferase family protein [Fundidesulfovibrio terrae]